MAGATSSADSHLIAAKMRMWESLRADARHEDSAIESRLAAAERLALVDNPDDATEAKFAQISTELEEQVRKLQNTVTSMMETAKTLPPSAEASSMLKHTQRFEEIAQEKFGVLRRLRVDFHKRKERAQLLGKVKNEIQQAYQENEELRHLSNENESLRHTQRRLNDILAQADLSRERLKAQRQLFANVGDKALAIAEKVPFINGILKKIDAKRRRDVVILAIIMGVLAFFVFLFW